MLQDAARIQRGNELLAQVEELTLSRNLLFKEDLLLLELLQVGGVDERLRGVSTEDRKGLLVLLTVLPDAFLRDDQNAPNVVAV